MAKKDNSDDKQLPLGQTIGSIGHVEPRPIVKEMEDSYLSYAMSVIVARALPDARDGLKPVHRRILYSMHELGLRSSAKFRKSATVVGDVLGKYHPHGDSSVYEAMVRMAQEFAMRYPLIHGQGNFGSIDGDGAAAMRYTESKMEQITDEMLLDIEKDTVEFRPNYDGSRKEPAVLPAKMPNLLLNGTVGIAVGMATNIPPHNLGELVDALLHLTENPDSTVEDLLEFVKGPDFPTAGFVYDKEAIKQAYLTGRGSVIMRGKAIIDENKSGRQIIHISEIPYQVNKSTLIEKIARLVTDKVIVGISDVRDESDRNGIRVIIELKKDSYPQKILNQLYKFTDLQTSFGYNCIALADGLQPKLLNLQELLSIFVAHRRNIITRRVTFDRDRAKERAHILEGLKIAIDNIDAVIKTIRASADTDIARENLVKKFKLTVIQADAILAMQLRRLAALERQKIEDELKEILAFIKECEAILKDPKRIDKIMTDEFKELKKKYDDGRRTKVVPHGIGEFSAKDTIPNEPMIVALTEQGYVKRMSPAQFRAQHRGGKGVIGMTTKEEDEILVLLHGNNHDDLLFFTNTGRVFTMPVYVLPQAGRTAKGQAIVNLLQLQPQEKVTAILKAKPKGSTHLFLVTKKGTVKRTELKQFQNIRKSGLIAQKVPAGDELKWVLNTSGKDEIFIVTHKGKSIRFKEGDVRAMGRSAAGVRGIRLGAGDEVVVASQVADPETNQLLVIMENGLGKASPVSLYRLQGRGGTGVKAAQLNAKTGNIVGGCVIPEGMDGELFCLSKKGQAIRMKLSDIPTRGRATQGVIVMRLDKADKIASMSVVMVEAEKAADVVTQGSLDLPEKFKLVEPEDIGGLKSDEGDEGPDDDEEEDEEGVDDEEDEEEPKKAKSAKKEEKKPAAKAKPKPAAKKPAAKKAPAKKKKK